MIRNSSRALIALATTGALVALTACSGGGAAPAGGGGELDPKADVTITVGDYPTADQAEQRKSFDESVKRFEKANPNITIKPSTEKWNAQTFQAKLAGGTLPTVMGVSLTYSHQLITDGKVPDMTPYLKDVGLLEDLNPLALKNVQDGGKTYAVPLGLFSVGLAYNREIFEKAGLDPDKPPTTWDEVRSYAKTISEKVPGTAGYAQLTTNNTGGWMLTTMTYGMGGAIQDPGGTKSVIGEPTKKALQLLHDMRWEDDSMGKKFLYNQEEAQQDFAAGKIGMIMQAPDMYNNAVINFGMNKEAVGEGELPQDGGPHGTLTGGTIKLFNVKATPNELLAAAKWVKYAEFDQYYDEKVAKERAKEAAAGDAAVGLPGLPPVAPETNERYLGWVKDEINVPREHFRGYIDSKLELIAEPPTAGQETYAALDPVVQKILTDENADIAKEIEAASKAVDGIIAQANR